MPIYEDAQTLANERRVMDSVTRRFGIVGHKMPLHCSVDFVLTRNGKGWGWAEVKCRWNLSTRYPTYMIDLSKVEALRALSRATDSHARIIVRWDDCLGVADAKTVEFMTVTGGRTDRGDKNDIDVVALIPLEHFRMYPLEDLEGMVGPKKH
jgi:hypothetical protein